MARTPDEVISFLEDLAKKARPFAEKDLEELRAFAKTELGIDEMKAWDMAFVSEKLRQKRYAFSEQEVKQYFPEPNVLEGLFKLSRHFDSVTILPDTAPVWHKDVKFFRIEKDGKLIGQFYMDYTPVPENAEGHGWTMPAAVALRKMASRRRWPI